MLYDLFICHASEDKDSFVRLLAEELQKQNIEVWYDEFSLKLGDSIRRSIDTGLKQSRFGIIVLSKAFFNKGWTQYELDGLNEREIAGRETVILPIWHDITHKELMEYSPSIAGKKGISTSKGLTVILDEILKVVRPEGSPLIEARDELIHWGLTPPVVTDKYWLDIVEASNRSPAFGGLVPEEAIWGRWSFPLPEKSGDAKNWGYRLAWTAMQLNWVETAERIPITPLTRPEIVLDFIDNHPGLFETCEEFPSLAAEYAPQLTIPGMGGNLENIFEEEYNLSQEKYKKYSSGKGLTVNGKVPLCGEEWSLRHQEFGGYEPGVVTGAYFQSKIFGPRVSPFEGADHLFWLLSKQSNWLPAHIHKCLLEGMAKAHYWPWSKYGHVDDVNKDKSLGKFQKLMFEALEGKKFKWTKAIKDDIKARISFTISELKLQDTANEIFDNFLQNEIVEKWIQKGKERREQMEIDSKESAKYKLEL